MGKKARESLKVSQDLMTKVALYGYPDHPDIGKMITTLLDAEVAIFVSKMLTSSLMAKMQTDMKVNLFFRIFQTTCTKFKSSGLFV